MTLHFTTVCAKYFKRFSMKEYFSIQYLRIWIRNCTIAIFDITREDLLFYALDHCLSAQPERSKIDNS